MLLGLVAVLGDLDPSRLAAAPDLDLGLDHAGVADLVRRGDRLLDRLRVLALGHGHAVLGEQLFSLVFEEVQKPGEPILPNSLMALPKLKDITLVTTDCYGTLIDWEKGITDAFKKEADRDGLTLDTNALLERFFEAQAQIMSGSYELYAEVLRRAAVTVAEEIGWTIEPSRAQFLPDSVASWQPFREVNAATDRIAERYEVGIVSNVDDKLLGISRRHLRTELDLVVTAQQVRSYKPDNTHFRECARRIGGKKGWVHIASGYESDIAPCLKMNVPVIWVNRHGEKLEGRKAPDATVKNLREAAAKLGAK